MNENLAKIFESDPITSFKRTRNLREIIRGNNIINNNFKITKENTNIKCCPCKGRKNTMCCWQVKTTTSSQATKTRLWTSSIILRVRATLGSVFYINYSMWENQKHHLIYALILKDLTFERNVIPACRYFSQDKHRFNKHAQFTLIESITNTNKRKEALWELLIDENTFGL